MQKWIRKAPRGKRVGNCWLFRRTSWRKISKIKENWKEFQEKAARIWKGRARRESTTGFQREEWWRTQIGAWRFQEWIIID